MRGLSSAFPASASSGDIAGLAAARVSSTTTKAKPDPKTTVKTV